MAIDLKKAGFRNQYLKK